MCAVFFFFKQKTAYEIGLGIPAEPLFRSLQYLVERRRVVTQLTKLGYDATPFNQILKQNAKREMRLRLGKVTVADVLAADRKSVVYGKSVDLGGRRIIKKKK